MGGCQAAASSFSLTGSGIQLRQRGSSHAVLQKEASAELIMLLFYLQNHNTIFENIGDYVALVDLQNLALEDCVGTHRLQLTLSGLFLVSFQVCGMTERKLN